MSFRLTTLFWITAVTAVSFGLFGTWGWLAVVGVLLVWAAVFQFEELGWIFASGVGGMLLVIVALFQQPLLTAVEGARASACLGYLNQVGLLLRLHEEATGALPSPTVVDKASGEEHSWRIAALQHASFSNLFNQYAFDEPWDGPKNRRLPDENIYSCPSHRNVSNETNYFAIVGPQTAWGDGEPRSFSDVTDGLGETLLLIEAAGLGIDWKEPRDLSFDEAVALLSSPIDPPGSDGHFVDDGYFYKPSAVRNVVMCDGRCHRLRVPLPRETAIALLTASGGEAIDVADLERLVKPEYDTRTIGLLAAFVVVALLPLVPIFRRRVWPASATGDDQ